MAKTHPLGDYLRARRQLVQPEDVGLRVTGLRRVPGLRREEVALLAGISSDYYLRLEQGRDRNPSLQVLEALAQVLQLDENAREYLMSLAQPRSRTPSRPRAERVAVGIRQLLDVVGLPAFVEGRYFDVLASNRLAQALSPTLVPGTNRLRSVFLDPAERDLYPDWDRPCRTWWPVSGPRSASRSTTRGVCSWWASSRWPASRSGGCGPGTT
jgi:transcriptional regulator with XRE-family HTH domain